MGVDPSRVSCGPIYLQGAEVGLEDGVNDARDVR